MDQGIVGRRALVSCADSGIGLHTAKQLLAEGVKVAITDKDPQKLEDAATERSTMTKTAAPDQALPGQSATVVHVSDAHSPGSLRGVAETPVPRTPHVPPEALTGAVSRNLVVRGLDGLVRSAQPAVVFTALTRLLVPRLCDRCEVVLLEADTPGYRIAFPNQGTPDADPTDIKPRRDAPPQALGTPIAGAPGAGRAFYGNLICVWDRTRGPSAAEAAIAQLAVDHAVRVIRYARLHHVLDAAESGAAELMAALASRRDIEVAVGILMGRNLIAHDVALDMLKAVSRDRHRRLRDVAADVTDSGDLPRYAR